MQKAPHKARPKGVEPDSPHVYGAILVIESRSVLRVGARPIRKQAGG